MTFRRELKSFEATQFERCATMRRVIDVLTGSHDRTHEGGWCVGVARRILTRECQPHSPTFRPITGYFGSTA